MVIFKISHIERYLVIIGRAVAGHRFNTKPYVVTVIVNTAYSSEARRNVAVARDAELYVI